mmetsp:Transcript_9514/g.16281  ORF Transcript_9514/g.16281 Transcript_9514/m.16281 type:complete len:217 (+) Transcript_9514:607-1257(+)
MLTDVSLGICLKASASLTPASALMRFSARSRVEILVLGSTSQSFSTAASVNAPSPYRLTPQSAFSLKLSDLRCELPLMHSAMMMPEAALSHFNWRLTAATGVVPRSASIGSERPATRTRSSTYFANSSPSSLASVSTAASRFLAPNEPSLRTSFTACGASTVDSSLPSVSIATSLTSESACPSMLPAMFSAWKGSSTTASNPFKRSETVSMRPALG